MFQPSHAEHFHVQQGGDSFFYSLQVFAECHEQACNQLCYAEQHSLGGSSHTEGCATAIDRTALQHSCANCRKLGNLLKVPQKQQAGKLLPQKTFTNVCMRARLCGPSEQKAGSSATAEATSRQLAADSALAQLVAVASSACRLT